MKGYPLTTRSDALHNLFQRIVFSEWSGRHDRLPGFQYAVMRKVQFYKCYDEAGCGGHLHPVATAAVIAPSSPTQPEEFFHAISSCCPADRKDVRFALRAVNGALFLDTLTK